MNDDIGKLTNGRRARLKRKRNMMNTMEKRGQMLSKDWNKRRRKRGKMQRRKREKKKRIKKRGRGRRMRNREKEKGKRSWLKMKLND